MRFPRSILIVSYLSALALLSCFWPATTAADEPKVQIDWADGPITARLGDIAEIKVPAGYRFTGKEGTRKFLELTHNPPSSSELGTIIPITSEDTESKDSGFWFVIFEFNDVGYVKDDERDKLNADALLPAYYITSWYKPPFYDVTTKNLTWAMQGYSVEDNKQEQSVNYSVRILGRRGTMNADLVFAPNLVANAVPRFETLLSGFSYLPGSAYSEFRAGDKVAKYGLAALVVGGAAAIATKTGLLAKIWKLIVLGVVAFIGFLKRVWQYLKRLFAGKASEETPEQG